jgi:hypothetical protein
VRKALVSVVAIATVGTIWALPAPADHGIERTCGTLPGEGAYGYITTTGIRCAPAKRIAFRAHKRFCNRHNDCMIVPPTPISTIYKGRVNYHGWSCHVKDGWELLVISCRKHDMRLTYRAAA